MICDSTSLMSSDPTFFGFCLNAHEIASQQKLSSWLPVSSINSCESRNFRSSLDPVMESLETVERLECFRRFRRQGPFVVCRDAPLFKPLIDVSDLVQIPHFCKQKQNRPRRAQMDIGLHLDSAFGKLLSVLLSVSGISSFCVMLEVAAIGC